MVRQIRGMTQQQVADKSFCSNVSISLIESGTTDPHWTKVEAIADALDVNVAMLVMLTRAESPEVAPFISYAIMHVWKAKELSDGK